MNEKRVKTMRWAARILSLFPILFALAEVIFPHSGDAEVPIQEWIPVILMFTSVIGLVLAWRWEGLGGGISLGALFASLIAFWVVRGEFFPLAGLAPLSFILVPAVLFLACWRYTSQGLKAI